ncbi:hypothetical protein DRH27_06100 [Candidatus Falkowbacteria bacterium]|nr:MAG: hypothetical protein DRH27_06100 [Candidatus Falkowbacteria bacterium]
MRSKLLLAIAVTVIVIGLIAVVINTNTEVQLQQLDVRTKQNEINTLDELNKTYEIKLKDAEGDADQIKQLEQEQQELKQENERLQQELAAKRARQAEQARNVAYAAKPVTVTGDKQSWLEASGIPADQWWAVDQIVSRESGWNPNAVNPTSGACGLGQQLPCGKWAGAWNDPVAALKAQYGYVVARYGGYAQAVAFWEQNHWY